MKPIVLFGRNAFEPLLSYRCLFALAIAFTCSAFAQPASTGSGQGYPAKPIRLIVPFPAGGGVDGVARIAFQRLAELLGQQVVIDNRGGSGGVIAAEMAARAAPDGYTLFFGTTATQAITPHYYRKLPYDAVKDFAPITLLAGAGYILVVTDLIASSLRRSETKA